MQQPSPPSLEYKKLTLEEANASLAAITQSFEDPVNLQRMMEARQKAGSDIMLNLQLVLPVAMDIQKAVILNFGYEPSQNGVTQFMAALREHEHVPDISQQMAALKQRFMPPMPQMPPQQPPQQKQQQPAAEAVD